MKTFSDDLEACWTYLHRPTVHYKHIRMINLLERTFTEQKLHTKIIACFWTEKSRLKLVLAALWQAS